MFPPPPDETHDGFVCHYTHGEMPYAYVKCDRWEQDLPFLLSITNRSSGQCSFDLHDTDVLRLALFCSIATNPFLSTCHGPNTVLSRGPNLTPTTVSSFSRWHCTSGHQSSTGQLLQTEGKGEGTAWPRQVHPCCWRKSPKHRPRGTRSRD